MTAAGVAVEGLSLAVGDFRLRRVDFAIRGGEILVILGPNGSGKSVMLETIAGFYRPDAGRVLIADRDVTALAPEHRNVAFMVQNFGLFPHLTVAQNIKIAMRGKRTAASGNIADLPRGDLPALLDYFGIAPLARRAPQELSPGEKQRVALARALAADPDLFLFDEPFSALDAGTRDQLRDELLGFLRRLAIPAIFVTHDHAEAVTLADKVLVLRNGEVLQLGTATDVFDRPATAFIARFVGFENVLAGRIVDTSNGRATLAVGGQKLTVAADAAIVAKREAQAAVRADDVVLHPPENAPADECDNRLTGHVTGISTTGRLVSVRIDCGFPLTAHLLARQAAALPLAVGAPIGADIAADSIHLMPE